MVWPPGGTTTWPGGQGLAAGEEVMPRWLCRDNSMVVSSQSVRLSFFTATKTETIGNVRVATGSTAAGATPTLVRAGIYAVASVSPGDGQGDMTLLAASTNDTSLLAAANTAYTIPLAAPWGKVAGSRYAVGLLVVTVAATPTLVSTQVQQQCDLTGAPRIAALRAGQADLPATITAASLSTGTGICWFEVLP